MRKESSLFSSVGPILIACDDSQKIIAALKMLNSSVHVIDQGSYLRVLVPERCVLTRKAAEEQLGKDFILPGDLELVMPSFKGKMALSHSEVSWTFTERFNDKK